MKRKSRRAVSQMPAKPAVGKTKPKVTTPAKQARSKSSRGKVSAHRARMRAKGYRLVQMWLPDTRTPEFAAQARRQSLLANASPFAGSDQAWVDSLADWNDG